MISNHTYICKDKTVTKAFGRELSKIAKVRDVFLLDGTLGMGKTAISRAFIQELIGDDKEVPSPTFTLLQVYPTPEFDVYHFDLYRIKSAEEIFELGMEDAIYGGVSLIEWPEKMSGYAPKDVFNVRIESDGFDGRKITISVTSEDKKKRLEQITGF